MMFLLALGLGTAAHAATDHARIAFVKPGVAKGVVMDSSQYVKLVIEGPFVSHDKIPVSDEGLIDYVDKILKSSGATYLAIYVREGIKFGDVVRTLDSLRKTSAKDIAVNTVEIALGRDL